MGPSNHDRQYRDTTAHRGGTGILLVLVCMSVGLQLVNAWLIKFASATPAPPSFVIGILLLAVLVLGFARFVIWNGIYKRYPVSFAYPLSAIFFPAVVLLAWQMGETVGAAQIVGATVVMLGVARVVTPTERRNDEPLFPVGD